MKRLWSVLGILVSVAALVGIVWYEQPRQTTSATIVTPDDEQIGWYPEEATTQTTVEVTGPEDEEPVPDIDYSQPDLRLDIEGAYGDDIVIREVIGEVRKIDQLPSNVQTEVLSCPGITDRDMVVPIYSEIVRSSDLAVDVTVDYKTFEHIAVFEYDDGPACDDGSVKHGLNDGDYSHFTYWLVLSGAITPDHPDGDLENKQVQLTTPVVTLPHMETASVKLSGARLLNCDYSLGDTTEFLVVGTPSEDCKLAEAP